MLATALALVGHGFAVLPCRPRSKIPATLHGFKDASKDPDVVQQWWGNNAHFNVAIATGAVSNVFVIDIDGAEGARELAKLTTLPKTLTVTTASGLHLYFKWPGKVVPCSAGKVAPHVDIRGDGGYVLTPPSIHPSGKVYAWAADSASVISAAPDWLLVLALGSTGNGKCAAPAEEWRSIVTDGVAEGKRNCTTARLTGHLLHKYVDLGVVRGLMHCWNEARNQPPLPAADIDRIVDSISGKEARKRPYG